MVIVQLAFFMFIFIILFYKNFIKLESDFLERYVVFILWSSFCFVSIFHIKSALWITLLCAIGLILHTKSPLKNKIIPLFIAIFVFCMYRVPTNPAEFETYLIEEHGIHCLAGECLKVVADDDLFQLQATQYAIQGFSFDWYFVFAQGEIILNNENIKAINIAGFWIQQNN